MKRFLVGLTALAMVGAVARPYARQSTPAVGRQIVERVLVKVNGEIFTQRDLEEQQILAVQERNRNVKSPADLRTDASLQALLLEVTPKILTDAIDDLILVQRAHELNFKVSDAQFKDALESIKKENHINDDATLKKALEQQGMTMEQLRQQIEHTGLRQLVVQREIMSRVTMTEEEAHQYYDSHPNEFKSPATVTLREILIPVSSSPASGGLSFGSASDATAKAAADAALARIKSGEDFAKVAAEVSTAPTKANGGLMPAIVVDELAEAVRAAVDPLKAGGVSEVIKTGRGYQIFKVDARSASGLEPFDKVHKDIMDKVYAQRSLVEVKKYVERLRKQALIEWKDESLKKLYEARIASGK